MTDRDQRRGHKRQQGEHRAAMRPQPDAPPGLEQDGKGRTIPLEERTAEDQEKARAGKRPPKKAVDE